MSYSLSMNFDQKQSLKQSQRLMMSPQMQQAIHMLQMPVMELGQMIDVELEQNPVLEPEMSDRGDPAGEGDSYVEEPVEEAPGEREVTINDGDFEIMKRLDQDFRDHFNENGGYQSRRSQEEEKLLTFLESSISLPESLFESLMRQATEHFETELEIQMAEAIIGSLDERGFLDVPLEEIALLGGYDLPAVQGVLTDIQRFDPPGVGARGLKESLLIQLEVRKRRDSLAYRIVEKHFDDLLHNRIPAITRSLNCSAQEVRDAVEGELIRLDLQPSAFQRQEPVQHIVPDVTLKEEDGKFIVEVNEGPVPGIRLNSKYMRMLEDPELPDETKEYVKKKLMSGQWLMRNIHQRNQTIQRIVECLSIKQREFFAVPDGKLHPLTMKTVAEELGLHESTIARAVANKYVYCPRGVLALRSFFTNAYVTEEGADISANTVRDAVKEIVTNEDKAKPISDDVISKMLKDQGINCARRTVSKYRKQLGIPTASQRRQWQ